ncbi:secreted protein [Rhodopirellula sp. SWK7]|uniref:secreted protein n=1 Tax=Rhodopirellula sp. SWK7 TaxID=595460 RepID=UPI0002BFEE55|nr:secreted protein [Rhodopirellula sp. SWK7]EMI43602.1 secreted protein [Rhodopirellula sp. SWK7]
MYKYRLGSRWALLGNRFAVFATLVFAAAGCRGETSRPEVIIYLANETSPVDDERENYETIIKWLNSERSQETQTIVDSFELDQKMFPLAVDLETTSLAVEVPKQQESSGLVVLTNGMFRSGKYLLWKPGFDRAQETPLPIASSHPNLILAANPLSRADTIAAVLSFVATQFDPNENRFVLVIKSHGSGTKVMTPRLAVRATDTNRNEVLRVANNQAPAGELPLWTDRLGVSKPEFLSILGDAGRHQQMNFSLVYLEACNAMKHEFAFDQLPTNVEQLLLIRERANYVNIPYADVVQRQSQCGSFSKALLAILPNKFVVLGGHHRASCTLFSKSIPDLGYFIPLALWLLWTVRRPMVT